MKKVVGVSGVGFLNHIVAAILNLNLALVQTSSFLRRSRSIVMLSEAKHPSGLGFSRGTGCFGGPQHEVAPPTVNIKFLLGTLNSRLIHFYLGLIAETSGMETTRWINNYVKEFPTANPISEQQEVIIGLVDQIFAAKQTNPQADTRAWEAEIDRLVYALYGLTPAKIAIVEGRADG